MRVLLSVFLSALPLLVACPGDSPGTPSVTDTVAADSASDVGQGDTAGPDGDGLDAVSDGPSKDVAVETAVDTIIPEIAPDVEDGGSDDTPVTLDVADVEGPDDGADDIADPDVPVADVTDAEVTSDTATDTAEDIAGDIAADAADDTTDDGNTPDAAMDTGSPGLPDGPSSERHTERQAGTTASAQGYYEYLPPGYGDGQPRPLLVFLHGLGENGNGTTELADILNTGITKIIEQDAWPSDRPFVVLSPQNSKGGCSKVTDIKAFLAFAQTTYDIDPARIYITGLSCGAIGLWAYLAAEGDNVIAAAVPIAGDGKGPYNNAGCALADVPIWAFHGDADGTVNVSGTLVPMNGLLNDCQPLQSEIVLTIYPGVGHNSWQMTYNLNTGHDIYSWLLQWTNPGNVPPDLPLEAGRTAYFDFGPAGLQAAAPWNSVVNVGGSVNYALNDLGSPTTLSLSVTDEFGGSNSGGIADTTVGFPTEATSDCLWVGSFDGHDAAILEQADILVTGLEPGASYSVVAYPGRTGNDGGLFRLTRYEYGSGQFVDVEASNNADALAQWSATADSAGQLTFTVRASPAGTGRFGYLNALSITRD